MSYAHENHNRSRAGAVSTFNLLAAGANLEPSAVDRLVRRGHRLRAEALQRIGRRVVRGALAPARRTLDAILRWREVRATERELRSLSPATLRDIGIEGHQIPAIARGIGIDRHVARRDGAQVQPLHPKAAPIADRGLDKAA